MFWNVTDADIKQLADCSINLLVTTGELDAEDTARLVLQSGMKYDVQTLLKNYAPWDYNIESPTPILLSCYAFYDFESYLGNHVFDEPGSNFFDEMAHLANRYNSTLPDKVCYFNLLPMYANAAQLKEASLFFALEGQHTVSAWIQGKKVALTPNANGYYTLNLDSTEGVFVTID